MRQSGLGNHAPMRKSPAMKSVALKAIVAVIFGIMAFSMMDASMKAASLKAGVYSALVLRNLFGTVLMLPPWLLTGASRPTRQAMTVHVVRAAVVACMAPLFFWGIVRIPLAEGIAVSFIAPLVALYLARPMLGERIRPAAIMASLLGLAGVLVIAGGRFGEGRLGPEAAAGIAAILASAMFYAMNLVLQRKQALLARPVEIALFQNLIVGLVLLLAAPWLFAMPSPGRWATSPLPPCSPPPRCCCSRGAMPAPRRRCWCRSSTPASCGRRCSDGCGSARPSASPRWPARC